MARCLVWLAFVVLIASACASTGEQATTEVPTTETAAPPTVTASAIPSPTPEPTQTSLPTATPTPTASPTVMIATGATPSPTPEPTRTLLPTELPPPTASPTAMITMSATPAALKLAGPEVSHDGVSFSLDPALGDGVFVAPEPGWLDSREFSFQSEGYCREVGCVTVYPLGAYRDGTPFGGEIVESLQAAIESGSKDYFPTVGAAILLRAQTRHLRFQNGAGIRAIVMRGQDGFFANNEAVVYDFHGLSADGQYYVVVRVPVDAPILLSSYDPAENTNPDALPVPELPDDADRLIDVMREYNQEAERQLDLLDGARFVPDLGLLDALVGSLLVGPPPP